MYVHTCNFWPSDSFYEIFSVNDAPCADGSDPQETFYKESKGEEPYMEFLHKFPIYTFSLYFPMYVHTCNFWPFDSFYEIFSANDAPCADGSDPQETFYKESKGEEPCVGSVVENHEVIDMWSCRKWVCSVR